MTRESLDGERTFVIHQFLSPEECAAFIQRSEAAGYDDAPITTASGFVMRKDIRNNGRVMIDDPALAQVWYERALPFLVPVWERRNVVGFNERFRYYRYDPGQRFALHSDGAFLRENLERSFFTFMVYLNDDFEGGETSFHEEKQALYSNEPSFLVKPERGKALVFYHHQLHEGRPVLRGRKYVLRTDVMYSPRLR